jgi:hypothetical protein
VTRAGLVAAVGIVTLATVTSHLSYASADACGAQPSRGEVSGALLAIYYWTDRPTKPPPIRLPGPQDASRILACDESRGSSSRRRRAIGRLALAQASRPESPSGIRLTALERHVFDVSLAQLGAPDGLVQAIEDASRRKADLQEAIETFLDEHPNSVKKLSYERECCACLKGCSVKGPDAEGLAVIDFQVELGGVKIEDAQSTIDPQSWSQCDTSCQASYFVGTTCPSTPPSSPPTTVSTTAPTIGTDWQGVIFEHVNLSDTSFAKNLLNITAQHASSGVKPYVVQYGLCHPLELKLDGAIGFTPTLKEDCGFISTFAVDADTTTVNVLKAVNFQPTEQFAEFVDDALEFMAGELVGVGLCCTGGEAPAQKCDTICKQDCLPDKEPVDLHGATLCKAP